MVKKQVYRISEKELAEMVSESVRRVISEMDIPPEMSKVMAQRTKDSVMSGNGVLGVNFGIKKRMDNKKKLPQFRQYASELNSLTIRVQTILSELDRRIAIFKSLNQLNEGAGAGSKLINFARKVAQSGNRELSPAQMVMRKANKANAIAGTVMLGAYFLKIPDRIIEKTEQLSKNPDYALPTEVSEIYTYLASAIKGACETVNQNPAIFGADCFDAALENLTNGQQEQGINTQEIVEDGFELAKTIGIASIPFVGAVYDIVTMIGDLVAQKPTRDEEALNNIPTQRNYLVSAITKMEQVLNTTKAKALASVNQ